MSTKSLYSKQVWWAQKLSGYHFSINYCQNNANTSIDTLSRFAQKSYNKEKELPAKNIQSLYLLHFLLFNASLVHFNLSNHTAVS